jgi:ubiquitin C-terminal hydrolase
LDQSFLGRQYTDGEQYDAHEFLMSFLDKMHDELNISSNSKKIKSLVRLKEKIEQLREGESHWKNSLMANSSIITDLFQV